MGEIRLAIGRNIKRCGVAADTPYYSVMEQITEWYRQRHVALWSEFIRLSDEEKRWKLQRWPYRELKSLP